MQTVQPVDSIGELVFPSVCLLQEGFHCLKSGAVMRVFMAVPPEIVDCSIGIDGEREAGKQKE